MFGLCVLCGIIIIIIINNNESKHGGRGMCKLGRRNLSCKTFLPSSIVVHPLSLFSSPRRAALRPLPSPPSVSAPRLRPARTGSPGGQGGSGTPRPLAPPLPASLPSHAPPPRSWPAPLPVHEWETCSSPVSSVAWL